MQTPALEQEKRYLKISVTGNVLVGSVGIAVATISSFTGHITGRPVQPDLFHNRPPYSESSVISRRR